MLKKRFASSTASETTSILPAKVFMDSSASAAVWLGLWSAASWSGRHSFRCGPRNGFFLLPDLRPYRSNRRYEEKLNMIVERPEDELARIDMAYLLSSETTGEIVPVAETEHKEGTASGAKLGKGRVH